MSELKCPMCDEGPVIAKWTEIQHTTPLEEVLSTGQIFASKDYCQDQDDLKLYCTACEYTWVPERGSITIV